MNLPSRAEFNLNHKRAQKVSQMSCPPKLQPEDFFAERLNPRGIEYLVSGVYGCVNLRCCRKSDERVSLPTYDDQLHSIAAEA
jgi:hypothetical protein